MATETGLTFATDHDKIVIIADQENQQTEMDIAQYPVEEGSNLVDNAKFSSNEINITGVVVGKDLNEANAKATKIYDWQKTAQLIHVSPGIIDWSYLVKSYNKKFEDSTANSVAIDVTIIKVRKPVGSFNGMKNSGVKQPSAPAATYITVVSGDTYWGWSMRYGTSIQQLRDWNHWADRFIPIGVRARVK